jgi:hypothetical protein
MRQLGNAREAKRERRLLTPKKDVQQPTKQNTKTSVTSIGRVVDGSRSSKRITSA